MVKKIQAIQDLTPDQQNANQGTQRGAYMVSQSLSTLGAGRSIVVDKEGRVIAGNKTLQAAADLELPIRVIETDGKELVVVQRNDLDLSDQKGKARQLAYADNRASEVGLAWDIEQLLADVESGLDLADWFHADELEAILNTDFLPVGEETQGDLDSTKTITCPNCGHEFTNG